MALLVLKEKRVRLVTRVLKVQLARLAQQAKRDKLVLRALQDPWAQQGPWVQRVQRDRRVPQAKRALQVRKVILV